MDKHRGDKAAFLQFLIDDCNLEPDKQLSELTVKDLTKAA